jgi:glycerophosphoryl diester phosphodiesterase
VGRTTDVPSSGEQEETRVHSGVAARLQRGHPLARWMLLAPTMRTRTVLAACIAMATVVGATPATAGSGRSAAVEPTLVQRATLSADFVAPGPPSGAMATPANGRTGPFPGQVIPGFSGMVDNGDGTFWAMPDNGFGTKANSADFLLRLYLITPRWETAEGGSGEIEVGRHISLRDPDRRIPFPVVNGATTERLLTGGDFDIESVVRAPDGSFWIGEEFGPFLLHVDATGRVLAPPVGLPDGKSPAHPFLAPGEEPRVRSSRGFEAMAASADGRPCTPSSRGPSPTTPSSVAATSTSSTPVAPPTPGGGGSTRPMPTATSSVTRSPSGRNRCC